MWVESPRVRRKIAAGLMCGTGELIVVTAAGLGDSLGRFEQIDHTADKRECLVRIELLPVPLFDKKRDRKIGPKVIDQVHVLSRIGMFLN